MTVDDKEIESRLRSVLHRISAAAVRAGRDPAGVKLVAVTKEVPPERALAAVRAGAHDLGENRVQEMLQKMEALAGVEPGMEPGPRWHFVGTLQRNKVRRVVGRVELVHGVDSIELGLAIAGRAEAGAGRQAVLLEVNTSGEKTKHGFAPADLAGAVRRLGAAPGLAVNGLMTIAPEGGEAGARSCFRALHELASRLRAEPGGDGLVELSMGMSGDFEAAVEEGSTMVRVGSAIFGARR